MEAESVDTLSQRILERWRSRRQAMPAQAPPAGIVAAKGIRLMMVQQVVPADAQYGPHLLAGPVVFGGMPPVACVAGGVAVRCYPVPGRTVDQYAAGETVKVFCAAGANLAEKMA